MQTFLPYQNFRKSAACLDNKRLGKQRVEALQVLRVLCGLSSGWQHHPAVLMWRGHEVWLLDYGLTICDDWCRRGFRDTVRSKLLQLGPFKGSQEPFWLTRQFCRSHQSNLVRKDPIHYRKFFPQVPDDLPYVWPVVKN